MQMIGRSVSIVMTTTLSGRKGWKPTREDVGRRPVRRERTNTQQRFGETDARWDIDNSGYIPTKEERNEPRGGPFRSVDGGG